jgi:spermidine/putrescine transport system substrate-binding protein
MRILLAVLLNLLIVTAHADGVLHLYWNNYISDETIARFEHECACRVKQDYYG